MNAGTTICKAFIACLCCLFLWPLTTARCQVPALPNVVIILADDMGYGDVSCLNPAARTRTPNIDELASQGIRFTDAHAAGSVCIPSRYGLLTGRYFFRVPPQRIFWGYGAPLIEQGRETIGSLMQRAGYATACIGKWHLGLEWPLRDPDQPQIPDWKTLGPTNTDFSGVIGRGPTTLGFDYSFIMPASLDMPPYVFVKNDRVVDPEIVMVNEVYPTRKHGTRMVWDQQYAGEDDVYWGRGIWWRNGEMSASFRVEDCLDVLVDEGVSFIQNHLREKPDQPFLLYLPLTGPHTPWVPGEAFNGTTELGTYGDFIAHIDHVVYRISQTLASLNAEENTLLIFTSDNGGHWSEEDKLTYAHESNWGARGQKGDIWDGGHHVPFFVKWPARIRGPLSCHQTIGLIDIIATLSGLTGQQIMNQNAADSHGFYPILKGEMNEPARNEIVYLSSKGQLGIKAGDWKYIDCLGSGGFTEPALLDPVQGGPRGQLYNLKKDPLERNNLYLEEPEIVRQLTGLLHGIVKQ